jgi:hypothetical protein
VNEQRPTVVSLTDQTAAFLAQHWHPEALGSPRPSWSERWEFKDEIPGQQSSGCYALLKSDEVVYVGVGAGMGPARYKGAGLGSRLHIYWCRDPAQEGSVDTRRRYRPTVRADGVTSIMTIGFDSRYWYMAYALEAFLIDRLCPERNTVGKRWRDESRQERTSNSASPRATGHRGREPDRPV